MNDKNDSAEEAFDSKTKYPIAEFYPDLEIVGDLLGEDESVDFALLIVRLEDSDGRDAGWSYKTTEKPNREELLGALEIRLELLKRSLLE